MTFRNWFSFCTVGSGIKLRSLGLEVNTFTHNGISSPLLSYLTENYDNNYHMAYVIIFIHHLQFRSICRLQQPGECSLKNSVEVTWHPPHTLTSQRQGRTYQLWLIFNCEAIAWLQATFCPNHSYHIHNLVSALLEISSLVIRQQFFSFLCEMNLYKELISSVRM